MTMAEDVAHIALGEETAPMALVWGLRSAPQTERPESLSYCKPGQYNAMRYIPGVLRQFFEESPTPICPYHRTLSMAQLGELPEETLAPYLAGRYVFVGANVPAYNDFVNSPIHGMIPGVHFHAMALDNLLNYRSDYKQSFGWDPPPPTLVGVAFLAVSAVFFVRVLWWAVGSLFGKAKDKDPGKDQDEEKRTQERFKRLNPVTRRAIQAGFGGVKWLLKRAAQTAVAMALIALLQCWFRIGMLPVTELLTMTLFAESFEYMKKLKWLLDGDAGKAG
jgi:hypothetical protein